jgi:hypothetical protein
VPEREHNRRRDNLTVPSRHNYGTHHHAPFTPLIMHHSLLSSCTIHSSRHAPFTPLVMHHSLLSSCTIHSSRHAPFTPPLLRAQGWPITSAPSDRDQEVSTERVHKCLVHNFHMGHNFPAQPRLAPPLFMPLLTSPIAPPLHAPTYALPSALQLYPSLTGAPSSSSQSTSHSNSGAG